ncbi:hypothetical protein [Pandoraea oxalativorans]|uniref:hypothetical protein n=1 Tax=Pandoraea oxalativorans TaxID=573737 RepID=UPI000AD83628|nr:hypothetical protein [Pandoraea oxalativorans]
MAHGKGLFAGSARAGRRGAAIMRWIRARQLNRSNPYVYLTHARTHASADANSR